jgi:hypothetical protein
MKYAIHMCKTCNHLKDGSCKNPVAPNKGETGGCSDWTNPELYSAWYEEFGKDYDAISTAVDEYLERRKHE